MFRLCLPVEMESSIDSFRQIIRQAWSRRVLLVVTTKIPPPSPDDLTMDYIATLRDPECEEHERSYHETALLEVNSLVRKYNAVAPYIARRALYTRGVELERLYKESAKGIHENLAAQLNSKLDQPTSGLGDKGDDDDPANPHGASLPSLGIWAMVKKLFTRVSSFSI